MENDRDNFSPEESLQVIQSMINQTRNSVVDNSFYFLLWGWLVRLGELLHFLYPPVLHRVFSYRPAPEIPSIGMGSHHLLGTCHFFDVCRL